MMNFFQPLREWVATEKLFHQATNRVAFQPQLRHSFRPWDVQLYDVLIFTDIHVRDNFCPL